MEATVTLINGRQAEQSISCAMQRAERKPDRPALNQGVLVEMLIQLSGFRQYDMAESVLATCDKDQLCELLRVSERAFSARIIYALEQQWRRSQDDAYRAKKSSLNALVAILNAWCAQGRRSAIRCVMSQMRHGDLAALLQRKCLDGEVHSMLHDYLPRQ